MVQARIAILEDSRGKVLVILPESQLLHLALLNHSYQRALHALPADQVRRIFVPALIEQPGMLDKLLGLPIMLDHALLTANSLNIVEPVSGLRFTLQKPQYEKAQVLRFAVNTSLLDSREVIDDEKEISVAVDRFTSLRIRERLADTLEIPPLPLTAQRIIQLGARSDVGIDELVPLVEEDPSLAAQVISWAASPYYAAPGKIASVRDAVVRVLGFDLVMNLALGLALNKALRIPDDGHGSVNTYWTQAVVSATLMEKCAAMMPANSEGWRPLKGIAYLAGLLHNFGYLVLAHVFPPHFSLINRYLECNRNLASHHVEKQVLGVCREQIGAWLLQCWQLPADVWQGIRHMNEPDYEQEGWQYAQLLYVVRGLMSQRGIGHAPGPGIDPQVFARLGLDEQACQTLADTVLDANAGLRHVVTSLARTG